MDRSAAIEAFSTQEFDLCIIGAGASGAGVALDASLRGMKVALIDAADFAGETSSKSTKLIHGGVRYLEQAIKKFDFGQLRQVKHGMEERRTLLNIAPHLARPLGLLTPVFSWVEAIYYAIGLKIYGLFARDAQIPAANWLNQKNTFLRLPGLKKSVHSAVLYYDGQFDDARFTLALAQTAATKGAQIANYVAAEKFIFNGEGQIAALEAIDRISGQKVIIKAKVFANCTGALADSIRKMADPGVSDRIRPSKGVHMVISKRLLPTDTALLIPKTKDGRVVFVIPFEGEVMIGTTDTEYKELDAEPLLLQTEIEYLLETVNRYFEKDLLAADVQSGFGGLRPLVVEAERTETKTLLRDHAIEICPKTGLFSLLGGKWTTYRVMAKDLVDQIAPKLNNLETCTTQNQKLYGAEGFAPKLAENCQTESQLALDICEHLVQKYGVHYKAMVEIIRENGALAQRVLPERPYLKAEVVYQVRNEMAQKPRDVIARRWRLELQSWAEAQQATPIVAKLMATELQWTDVQTAENTDQYLAILNGFETASVLA